MSSEQEIEKEIQGKGLKRLTPEKIDAVISSKEFHVSHQWTLYAISQNGFTVRGYASCVSAANYNKELGEKIAFENARKEVWQLEAYLLAQRLSEDDQ